MRNFIAVFMVLFLVSCGSEQEQQTKSINVNTEVMRADFVKLIQNGAEPKAKDANWSTPNTLRIGVLSDGTNRDGYAQYFCSVLSEQKFKGKYTVKIIDIEQVMQNKGFVELGKSDCIL